MSVVLVDRPEAIGPSEPTDVKCSHVKAKPASPVCSERVRPM